MTPTYEVRYDPQALAALHEAASYVEQESGAARASAWLRTMREGVGKLDTLPTAYPAVCFRRGRAIRSKLVVSHRVYFFVDEHSKLVYVIDLAHTARETKLAEYRTDD